MLPDGINSTDEGDSFWHDSFDYSKAPLNKTVLMDWIDQGLDFFGCDENAPNKVFSESIKLQSSALKSVDLQSIDYAKVHDEFLEALLYEQVQKPSSPKLNRQLSGSHDSVATLSLSASSCQSFCTSASSEPSSAQTNTARNKRPRPMRLHRRIMPALSSKSMNSEEGTNEKIIQIDEVSDKCPSGPSNDDVSVVLKELSMSQFPCTLAYLHPHCRMQKDKGKGEPVGSKICAKGREACLEKLRQKMELITKFATGDGRRAPADIKKRHANVSEIFPNFIETRSMIEIRMGFLSMQYGVLLRWDTSKTGRVTLVVLRKMCHEQFYTRNFKNLHIPTNKFLQSSSEPSYAIRNVVDGTHAILQLSDGMEVALLEPPYRVSRPLSFAPTILSVSVLYATGLACKSNWTVQLCHEEKTENLLLVWDSEQGRLLPKLGVTLKREIPMTSCLHLSPLDIRIYEHRLRRRSKRRCVADIKVPLHCLKVHPTSSKAGASEIKVLCTHDSESELTLAIKLESDYINWLRSELEERRREEAHNCVQKTSFRKAADTSIDRDPADDDSHHIAESDEADGDSVWEWFCSAC